MGEPLPHDLTDVYEAMIDWPKRLAHERAFYRRLVERIGAKTLVDVACGTGHHAAMFHSWGLEVEAADISPGMIERGQRVFGQPPGLRWSVRGFEQPIDGSFDMAICVGNSLALAPDRASVGQAVAQMFHATRPRGLAIFHVLNLWRLPDGPCVWQKCMRATLPPREVMIAKAVHRSGSRGYVELVVLPVEAPEQSQTDSLPLLGLEADQLRGMAHAAGAKRVRCFGGYNFEVYDRQTSVDLIVVAEK
jgi:SAM-dependent methyltransferase